MTTPTVTQNDLTAAAPGKPDSLLDAARRQAEQTARPASAGAAGTPPPAGARRSILDAMAEHLSLGDRA